MEKASIKKSKNGAGGIPNKALHSRVSYLFQAATFLSQQSQSGKLEAPISCTDSTTEQPTQEKMASEPGINTAYQPVSRRLVSDLRSVSLKVQIRMSPAMKHSICKNCDTVLIDSSTCTTSVENKSRGGRKPWADVLVRRCISCGFERRIPVGAERQLRRPQRAAKTIEGKSDKQPS